MKALSLEELTHMEKVPQQRAATYKCIYDMAALLVMDVKSEVYSLEYLICEQLLFYESTRI
jgi:hypothetical protein